MAPAPRRPAPPAEPDPPRDGSLRLTGGSTPGSGRLEVWHEGAWGSICQDNFGWRDARVACRELGYVSGRAVYWAAYGGGYNKPVWLTDVACFGNESRLVDCAKSRWDEGWCWGDHNKDVGLVCNNGEPTSGCPLCARGRAACARPDTAAGCSLVLPRLVLPRLLDSTPPLATPACRARATSGRRSEAG